MSVYKNGNQRCDAVVPVVGKHYKLVGWSKPLVYLGRDGTWYQYAQVDKPTKVWCELQLADLVNMSEVKS